MIKENQLVEMIDGTNYIILDSIEHEEKKYLYLALVDDELNSTGIFDILEEIMVEDIPTLNYIKDEELYENLKLSFEQRSEMDSIN